MVLPADYTLLAGYVLIMVGVVLPTSPPTWPRFALVAALMLTGLAMVITALWSRFS
jgi:hypothetical protein